MTPLKHLAQRIGAFLYHVIDAPGTAPETRATAEELVEEVKEVVRTETEKERRANEHPEQG